MTRPVDVESQASGDLTRLYPRSHPESEHSGLSFGPLHNHGPEAQFNTRGGTQSNNTGSGNQFSNPTFNGSVNFDQSDRREERQIKILRSLKTSPYQERKDRNPDRVTGTCDWFVSHKLFRDWQESKSLRTLWVTADPGCGKSVLAKYLVDSVLPNTESRTVCYFFFKDIEDQRSAVTAFRCILHQLFMRKRILLSDPILDQFDTEGEKSTSSFSELWQTLINAAEDRNAGEIVCLLDALDECEDQGMSQLAQKLGQLYGTERNLNLKFLLTSRPYSRLRQDFQPLVIHLSGEGDVEMERISQEIDVFIGAKVQDIGARLMLTPDEQDLLLRQLMRVPQRTYLWVHLTLDLIKSDISIKKTRIREATSHLPKTVDEAYDRILAKSFNSDEARKILHIIVAAARPLTLREMNLALVLQESHRSYGDLKLKLGAEAEDRFREEVRNTCGLFVTIIDSRLYLLHQTAKEFLVQNDTANSPEGVRMDLKWKHSLRPQDSPKGVHMDLEWKHSLQPQESHRLLAEICIWYLLFAEFETHPLSLSEDKSLSQYVERHIFLDYSAKHWAAHFRELQIEVQDAMRQSILDICDTSSMRCLTWFRIYWTSTNTELPLGFTTLMITSYFGLSTAVKHLLKMGSIDLNSWDNTYQRSALSWAAGNGFDVVVQLLINSTSISQWVFMLLSGKRAKINAVDRYGRTPLSYAVWIGNIAVVKLLIKAGARANLKDEIGGTPLSYAICNGHKEVIELLLKGDIQGDLEDISKELLFSAAKKGDEGVVRLLLDMGKTDLDARDTEERLTPLMWAAKNGHLAIIKLLLATGKVDVNAESSAGWTPLSYVIEEGNEKFVELLLKAGAKVDNKYIINGIIGRRYRGRIYRTPLSRAEEKGYEAIVKLLLRDG